MKKWINIGILSILVIGMILISGCTSTTPAATPTPQIVYVTVLVTPIPTVARAQDPIIGDWRYYNSSFGFDFRYRFNADGTYKMSYSKDKSGADEIYGTWTAPSHNIYVLRNSVEGAKTFFYDETHGVIYFSGHESIQYIRYQGDVIAASSTPITSSSPRFDQKASYQGKVIYPGKWQGAIGEGGSIKSISGSGTMTYDFKDPSGYAIVINGQKMDSSSQRLTVEILKNGNVIKSEFTDASYGLVQVLATI